MSITSCSALLAVSSQCLLAPCPAASKVQWIAAHLLHSLQCTVFSTPVDPASTIPQAVDSGWRDSIAGPTIASGLRANYLHCQLLASQSPLHSAIQPTINICISSILAIIDREKTLLAILILRKLFALSVSHWSPLSKLYIVIYK